MAGKFNIKGGQNATFLCPSVKWEKMLSHSDPRLDRLRFHTGLWSIDVRLEWVFTDLVQIRLARVSAFAPHKIGQHFKPGTNIMAASWRSVDNLNRSPLLRVAS